LFHNQGQLRTLEIKKSSFQEGSLVTRLVFVSAILVFLFALPRQSFAQVFRMDAVELLPTGAGTTGQVLGKTIPAIPSDWPATFTFKNVEGGGCTATAIGQKVILTAAHCVQDGSTGLVSTKAFSAQVTCFHHPNYPRDISSDFALCAVNGVIPKLGSGFERINSDPELLPSITTIILLGYGCLQPGGADRSFGTLYQGSADVQKLPGNDNFIIAAGDAAVCFGDSGGGAFSSASPATRRLIGVNARGDISKTSWLASTSGPVFTNWARQWSADHGVQICGLAAMAQGCAG
jgi:hypothetical protein